MPDVEVIKDVRELTADDLGIGYAARAEHSHGSSAPDAPELQLDDPRLATIAGLARRFGGVILSGPPGTSKSWLAGQVANHLTDRVEARRADIQFHASYQFEDFMEGYRPNENGDGGFVPREGVFLRMVSKAHDDPAHEYVIVIDELSRADVGRVFGEALTYIERSKRGLTFQLPSGQACSIPTNLLMIATMNPLDRGVDDVDAAFERRFAKVDMPPDRAELEQILEKNGLEETVRRRLVAWFTRINSRAVNTPAAAVGHAYFVDAVDPESLQEVWDYQLKYHVNRAFQYEPDTRDEIVTGWTSIFEVRPEDDGSSGLREANIGET